MKIEKYILGESEGALTLANMDANQLNELSQALSIIYPDGQDGVSAYEEYAKERYSIS